MKTVLITGGAGYIGSYVNKRLMQKGYKTIVLDNLSTGSRQACANTELIEADFADLRVLQKIFTENTIDAVIHFAALIDVRSSVLDPIHYFQNNVAKTVDLLNEMIAHNVRYFVFSSSAAIFGNPQEIPVKEDSLKQPINPYGEGKWLVEKMLQNCERAYPFRFVSLRYFNAAGADPEGEIKICLDKQTNLIPCALRSLINSTPIEIFGTDFPTLDGTAVRDYIHIHDLAEAHILSLEKMIRKDKSAFYNLGTGSGFSVRQVLAAIETVTKKKLLIKETKKRPGDPPILIADNTLAMQQLQWRPQYTDIKTIIRHAWEALPIFAA